MTRLGAAIIMVFTAAAFTVGGGSGGAQAQITIPTLFPTTTTTAPPPTVPGTPPTTASLVGSLLTPSTTRPPTTAAPAPTTAAPTPGRTPIPGNAGGEGEDVPTDAGPFPSDLQAKMNSVRRSGPRSSDQLVDALKQLTDLGMPLDQAMRVGMGRFPIAGRTRFVNDWWFPRFGPGWRLHEGTDMFADRGTPLRSPASGTVRFSDGGLGGISVYVTQADGTYFYLTHLDRRADGLKPGQQVTTGDIVGYVGSSGNAAGGSPHLHFEVHPAIKIVTVGKGRRAVTKAVSNPVKPGTVLPAIDPKPLLDLYLNEALAQLPGIVANYKANQPATPPPVATPAVPGAVVLASHRLSSGGLIAADAPLARTPLLGLAFMLIVMVAVLTPVLAPRRRLLLAGGLPPTAERQNGRTGGKGPARSRRGPRKGGKAAEAPVPAAPQPVVTEPPAPTNTFKGVGLNGAKANGNSSNGNGGKKKRGRRKAEEPASTT